MSDMKNDPEKRPSSQSKGSGSDTASAAKISAGTSVGNVGESPMPHAQPGAKSSAQSQTLSSHTSKPLGGQSAGGGEHPSSQGETKGATDTMKQAAQSATDTAQQAAEQVQEKAGEAYDQASEWARDTYQRASSWASDAYERRSPRLGDVRERSARSLRDARRGVQDYVAQNPVMVGLVGLAAGLLLGALLPRTRREDETFGEWADDVREQGVRYAREAVHRGREYVDEALSGDQPQFGTREDEYRPGQGPQERHH
jgi:ElaB/YqjD/DUF883 family membrane-anchored ribosome-binding protein